MCPDQNQPQIQPTWRQHPPMLVLCVFFFGRGHKLTGTTLIEPCCCGGGTRELGRRKNAHTYICIHATSLSHHPSMQQSSSIIHHPSIHASSMLHHPSSMHHSPVIVQRPSSIHRGSSMTHGWCWSWGEGVVWRGGLEMINNNMRIQ